MSRRAVQLACLAALLLTVGGCRGCTKRRPPVHLNPNMDYQAKVQPQEASEFFYDGSGMRAPVPGTVARDEPAVLDAFTTGLGADGLPVATVPAAARQRFAELETRGAERYAIYCAPCHGDQGDGKGVMFHRGGINSADLRVQRLRDAPDGQLFDVVSHGLGLMSGYAAAVPVADRWAIIAYVRELQAASPVPDTAPAAPAEGEAAPAAAPPEQTAAATPSSTTPSAATAGGAR